MSLTTCVACSSYSSVDTVLCGAGRTTVYGASLGECASFRDSAIEFDALIAQWTAVSNSTGAYPGCRAALEVLFCSQQPVYREDGTTLSSCNDHRRPDHTDVHRCLAFCPAVRDSCPAAAFSHCEERCRTSLAGEYCRVLEIRGLQHSRYSEDVLDLINLYRIEAEADVPLLRDGRPSYRSIPARRSSTSGGRATKLDYYLYSTRVRGFNEWLLDTNDVDTDGATAHASDGNILPYKINSDWSVWHEGLGEWLGEPIQILCRGDDVESSAAPRSTRRLPAMGMHTGGRRRVRTTMGDADFGYREMPRVLDEHLLPRFFKGEWLMDIEVTLVAVRPERPSRWERTRAFFETFGAR